MGGPVHRALFIAAHLPANDHPQKYQGQSRRSPEDSKEKLALLPEPDLGYGMDNNPNYQHTSVRDSTLVGLIFWREQAREPANIEMGTLAKPSRASPAI